MNSKPLVTVGIPTYNREHLVGNAIRSVLAQSYSNVEVIVSDNNSADSTLDVLKEFEAHNIKIVSNESNLGMVANWNRCLQLAEGDFFILLPDDDSLESNAVSELLAAVQSSEVVASYGDVSLQQANGLKARRSVFTPPKEESLESFLFGVFKFKRAAYPSVTLFHTEKIRAVGGYPEAVGGATDLGLLIKLSYFGFVSYVDKSLAFYESHEESESFTVRSLETYRKLLFILVSQDVNPAIIEEFSRYSRAILISRGRRAARLGMQKEGEVILEELRHFSQSPSDFLLVFLVSSLGKVKMGRMFLEAAAALRQRFRNRIDFFGEDK